MHNFGQHRMPSSQAYQRMIPYQSKKTAGHNEEDKWDDMRWKKDKEGVNLS